MKVETRTIRKTPRTGCCCITTPEARDLGLGDGPKRCPACRVHGIGAREHTCEVEEVVR